MTETHSAAAGNPVWISVCPSGDGDSGEYALAVKCVDFGLIAGLAPLDFLDLCVTPVSGCKVVVFTLQFLCTAVTSSPVGESQLCDDV